MPIPADLLPSVAPASVSEALDRIEQFDPRVGAFLEESDRRGRVLGEIPATGPLSGLAIGVKDLFRADGLDTRAGSSLPAYLFDGAESAVVSSLRAAGAVVAGKTAMDEFAWSEQPSTKNPRDHTRTPGGSSGGSAAAVAANMCRLAVGSQSMHSTITPASYCGVYGFATSYGRIPYDGVPLAPSMDTVGFLAADLPIIGAALSASIPDWRPAPAGRAPVLGVCEPWGVRRLHTEAWTAFGAHVRALRDAGFECRRARMPWTDDQVGWGQIAGDLQRAEFARVHRDWFARFGELYRPGTAEGVRRGAAVEADRLAECFARRDRLVSDLEALTDEMGVDCWVCPSGQMAPLLPSTGDSWMCCFWAFVGWPAVSLPIFDGEAGLPHGLQVVAPHGRDEHLLSLAIRIAAALAAMTPSRRGATDD